MTHFLQQRTLSLTVLPALLLSFACSAPDTAVTEPSASAQDALEAPAPQANENERNRRGHKKHARHKFHKRGPAKLLGAALRHLDLSDEQRTQIVELKASLKPSRDMGHPGQELRSLFSEGIKNGKLDRAAIDKVLAEKEQRMALHRSQHTSALNELHGILTPEQRQQLVSVVQQKANKRGFKGGPGPKALHHKTRGGGPGLHMLKGIELSREQRQELEALTPNDNAELWRERHQQFRAQRAALLEAFAQDKFDASTLPVGKPQHMREHMEQKIAFLTKLTTVLTPEQRSQVAERMLSGPFAGRGWGERGKPKPAVQ